MRAGLPLVDVVVSRPALEQGRLAQVLAELEAAAVQRVTVVPESVLAAVSTLRTPHDLVATAPRPAAQGPSRTGDDLGRAAVLALDGLQDPGNAGTVARSALAFGFDRVWFSKSGVDPYHPKVLRASAGTLFGFREVARVELPSALAAVRRIGGVVAALDPHTGTDIADVARLEPARPLVLVIGGEGRGVSAPVRAQVQMWLRIPMDARVESLNVAAAAAIALYELGRRGRL